jgi:hypothetical protein
LSDRRSSRAYEACLICLGDKLSSIKNEVTSNNSKCLNQDNAEQDDLLKKLKKILKKFSNYLVDKFDYIMETQNGIYSLRAFLRIIGNEDPLEENASNNNNKKANKRKTSDQFNMKNVEVKLLPIDWNMNKSIKKFAKSVLNLNLLGRSRAIFKILWL